MKVSPSKLEFMVAEAVKEAVNHVSGAAVFVFKYCTAWDAWEQYAAARRVVNEALPPAIPPNSDVTTFFDKNTDKRLPFRYERYKRELDEDLRKLDENLAFARGDALKFPLLNALNRYITVLIPPFHAVLGNSIYTGFFPEQTGSVTGWLLGGLFGAVLAVRSVVCSMQCERDSVQMLGWYKELRAKREHTQVSRQYA